MLLSGVAGFVKDLVGVAGGQALVPEVNGKAGEIAEFGGEGLCAGGLGAHFTGEVEGIADDDSGDREAPAEARQRAEIFAAVVAALEGQDRLRGQPELI